MRFAKYHALGNAYLVLAGASAPEPALVARLCDRRRGLGADGVLHLLPPGPTEPARLRVFNPDGSEAQTSGNGVRIAARWLWDQGLARGGEVRLRTMARTYRCAVAASGREVTVAMGRASFDSADLPMTGPSREVVAAPLALAGTVVHLTAVSLGNPHAVLHADVPAEAVIARWGPQVECHAWFPQRTNVQVVNVTDPRTLRVAVWERGAGPTPASGSSAAAAAAATRRLGRCEPRVAVVMRGGTLDVFVDAAFEVLVRAPVEPIAEGTLSRAWLASGDPADASPSS
jgi:diaminopimelate epimerase